MPHKVAGFDAEYAEVLRGPNDKLFGRNTIGGSLQVIRPGPPADQAARSLQRSPKTIRKISKHESTSLSLPAFR